ncbi:DUF4386 domain-containing protein [Actinoplanes friuliensis]|uniref:DUF4386 domain-containing protein n=1 Tax=Actinoplanes friuliensis DSM 7358 TaxID=1246995 RepID=U5VSK3_9ACTN|nr:DUF4386 domain-containing protein [Actinoplanes friuliensis]AGZ39973.1 hypothetical protein AFR_08420 [Actinoplanes friuliensis DSM 7358]
MIRTARVTGLLYLGLALTGGLGFLLIRSQLFVAGDPGATLAHLIERDGLARAGVALELLVVLTQALTAVWFYRLFRTVDAFAAGCIAAFGLVNGVAILSSAALLATASEIALHPLGDSAATVQLLYLISGHLWTGGALFFGLWLIPMGWCVLRSGWMPRPLGLLLIGGGAGYVLSPLVGYLVPQAGVVADLLTVPASVGEFWMVGYLLLRGIRPRSGSPIVAAWQNHATTSGERPSTSPT